MHHQSNHRLDENLVVADSSTSWAVNPRVFGQNGNTKLLRQFRFSDVSYFMDSVWYVS